jgi:hypothetical protein
LKACGDDADCRAAEEARHEAVVENIQARRRECVSGCHRQGGGRGAD